MSEALWLVPGGKGIFLNVFQRAICIQLRLQRVELITLTILHSAFSIHKITFAIDYTQTTQCVVFNTHEVLKCLKYISKKKHICIWGRKYYSVMKQDIKFAVEVSLDRTINSLWDEYGFSCPTSVTMTEHSLQNSMNKLKNNFQFCIKSVTQH